jgi:hypothetical protein
MRALSSPNFTALQARALVARDFIWFVVRDRTTGAPVTDGYWSDVGTITADVVDPDTGATSNRTWNGAGGLIQLSDIPLVSNITVQNMTVTLSQVVDRVNDLVRTYNCKQGRVEVYRGLFDPSTRLMVAPATPRFVGTIDEVPIRTPKEGDSGDIVITCTSNTQELTRFNPDTRSDASQKIRSSTDNFFQDVAVVGGWQHFWGRATGVITAATSADTARFSNGNPSNPTRTR